MSAIFSQLHWIHPAWLWALAGVPLLVFATWRRQQGRLALTRLVDPDMLPLLLHGTPRRRLAGALLAGLGWTLATLALAGPAWERLPAPMQQGQGAQVIVLSLSDTMLATDLTPDRLTRARYKVRDLVEASRGEQNALIAYAGAAFVVAPLTTDADTVLNLIDPLQPNVMPVPGNNAASAIELGVKLLAQAGISGGSIVLVTDGADAAAIAAAGKARAAGVTVSVLGVGGSTGAPVRLPGGGFLTDSGGNIVLTKLDADSLSRLAAAGGGRYRTLQAGGADITALHLQSGRRTAPSADAASARAEQWRDRGPWLLLPLLPLLALMFRRGWLVMVALVLLLPLATQPALAADSAAPAPATSVAPAASATASWWDALWRNRDQRAAAALAAGQPQVAATLARDPGLENAAHYRQGDYQAAAQGYAAQPGAAAAYNRGNALAREGQYEPAIKAYDKALAMQPDMADATHNRALVEQALKQQQQQQQQQSKNGQSPSSAQNGQPSRQGDKGDAQQQGAQASDPSQTHGQPAHAASTQGQQASDPSAQQAKPDSTPAQPAHAGSTSPATAAEDKAASRHQQQANEAVSKAMDQQLGAKHSAPAYQLGANKTDVADGKPLPQSMRQALERVPDDPGGLLRRKFQLEYQQRQHAGGNSQ